MNNAQLTAGNGGNDDSDSIHLELAFLFFLDQMRKTYLSESRDGRIFEKLKHVGIEDGKQLLTVYARKMYFLNER